MLKKLVTVALLLVAGSVLAGPQLLIPEVEYNFGKIPQHASVSHRFLIKSVGDETVQITKVVPGCGCTKAPLKDSVLAPGDSTWLEIIFSSRSYRGNVAKRPYIETDVSDEKLYVRITTDVLLDPKVSTPVRFHPFKLDVSQFGQKTRRTAGFSLINASEEDFEISLVDTSGRDFAVEVPTNKLKAGDTLRGRVIVHEDAVQSEFDQSFTVELNDKARTRYTLPVRRLYRERGPASFGSSSGE